MHSHENNTLAPMTNKHTGQVIQIGKLHTYDPNRAGLARPNFDNTPPHQGIILPLCFTEINGQTMVVFEWLNINAMDGGIELNVDYCVPEAVFRASLYADIGGKMMGKHEVALHNSAQLEFTCELVEKERNADDDLPRSADAILSGCADDIGFHGEKFDTTGRERSAAKIASLYNHLKGANLTAMDVWDLLMLQKLVHAQTDNRVASRADLTSLAALSAEEMESIVYGSGASEVDLPAQKMSDKALEALIVDLKAQHPIMQVITGHRGKVIADDVGKHIKINLFGDI